MSRTVLALCGLAIFLFGCNGDGARPGKSIQGIAAEPSPQAQRYMPCRACSGNGKVTQSSQQPLPGEIKQCKIEDHGVLNPDYWAYLIVANNSDHDGTYKLRIVYKYKGIGDHVENTSVFVKAHSTAMRRDRYDADNRADSFRCEIEFPTAVVSSTSVCPVCGGKGLVVAE